MWLKMRMGESPTPGRACLIRNLKSSQNLSPTNKKPEPVPTASHCKADASNTQVRLQSSSCHPAECQTHFLSSRLLLALYPYCRSLPLECNQNEMAILVLLSFVTSDPILSHQQSHPVPLPPESPCRHFLPFAPAGVRPSTDSTQSSSPWASPLHFHKLCCTLPETSSPTPAATPFPQFRITNTPPPSPKPHAHRTLA